MLAYTYISPGKFELIDKPKPELQSPRDAHWEEDLQRAYDAGRKMAEQ